MNKLNQKFLDSREVAEMVEKQHNELLKDIRRYVEQLGEGKIPQSDFFQESTYTNSQNKELPCFNVTKKGCEFIGNKLTGVKGAKFTALYINKFHDMEETIKTGIGVNEAKELELKAKAMRAEAMRLNAQTRAFKEMKDTIPKDKLSNVAFVVFGIKGLEKITGTNLGDFLPEVEKTYSASEVGNRLGITKNKVGRIATANNLKTDEYGITVMDKSPYSSKEVENFRYNEKGVATIKEIIEKDKVDK